MKTKPENYRLWLMSFGILTILKLLRHFEELENYEECAKIISAIEMQEKYLEDSLPRHMSEKVIEMLKNEFKKFNLTGDFIEESTDIYFLQVLQDIYTLENK